MTSSLLPLELRIRILESQLFGVPSSVLSDPNSPSPTSTSARTPAITHRIRNVKQCLDQLGESSDGVKRLLEGYSVKLAMVLEAASDIRGAERDLREIEVLKSRQVEGSGELEQLLPLRPNLKPAMKEISQESRKVEHARKNVGQLLLRYNDFV
ncbi:hypothetical protein I307_04693 [Cryptococcus deuterogattii 99/473]|uniref:Uncharacterized protein n=1 Tax=Cryptococcus deuterogattii Ram5 TaxID=1296110 RepID=A0A0D0V411_9TREE|nr:hypothetical protein I309_03417 [Cryptococcus deuterogattii LA55]KIR42131.1 hypothetical protein I313_02298 [Cryptococcus deuterogattii Ram5]KIR73044.1 hypothetical protein I310_02703 [Cryptococcus deuterogattii CA1014]KIR90179.1 hypothetical protein I304_06116 [Cryptococcus deuterogattii CBS 10090]KIY56026.1 hypothetical protein I307_04693 [Cryptococcus deuterogattii 99/473]